ncbi:MAG: hypothetical protein H0T79_06190, partial [Deltaproteobacteria bacterium]|nr:hypothetical protein [Deltaproteobacteria bacterium]
RYVQRRLRDLAVAITDELRAEAAHAERTSAIDLAHRQLTRARADREVIERHFAAWRDQRRKLVERREE